MWNPQLSSVIAHRSSSSKQTADRVPSTYRIAQQESVLWDYCSYDWHGFERKTMSEKHRNISILSPRLPSCSPCNTIPPFHFYSWWLLLREGPFQMKEREARWETKKWFKIKIKGGWHSECLTHNWWNKIFFPASMFDSCTHVVSPQHRQWCHFNNTFPKHLVAFKTKSMHCLHCLLFVHQDNNTVFTWTWLNNFSCKRDCWTKAWGKWREWSLTGANRKRKVQQMRHTEMRYQWPQYRNKNWSTGCK